MSLYHQLNNKKKELDWKSKKKRKRKKRRKQVKNQKKVKRRKVKNKIHLNI